MTGYGNAEIEKAGVLYSVELRSVNSKFFDLSIKLPKNHSSKENDFRDLIRNRITRGKITLSANIHKKNVVDLPIQINNETIKFLKALFKDLKKATGLREKIKLDHYLRFSEIFGYKEEELSDSEYKILMECAEVALEKLLSMKLQEGKELEKDISQRIKSMDSEIEKIQSIWKEKEDSEWKKLKEKAVKLLEGREPDIQRIET
ncbi:MAG: hypothetical protein N3A61_03555, partial [Ignavibacteria bacterium]|nr:hypothetical protein [Ignavibacteria bacterium]